MPRETAYFTTTRNPNGTPHARVCDHCSHGNPPNVKVCRFCGRRFAKRPKVKKDKTVGTRLRLATTRRDKWMRNLSLAVTKLRYYTTRIAQLEKKATPVRPKTAPRAIRLRDPR